MTTQPRRRLAILILIATTVLAYAIGFSTTVLNGVTVLAILFLAAGTFAAYKVQRLPAPISASAEDTIPLFSTAGNESNHHSSAA